MTTLPDDLITTLPDDQMTTLPDDHITTLPDDQMTTYSIQPFSWPGRALPWPGSAGRGRPEGRERGRPGIILALHKYWPYRYTGLKKLPLWQKWPDGITGLTKKNPA